MTKSLTVKTTGPTRRTLEITLDGTHAEVGNHIVRVDDLQTAIYHVLYMPNVKRSGTVAYIEGMQFYLTKDRLEPDAWSYCIVAGKGPGNVYRITERDLHEIENLLTVHMAELGIQPVGVDLDPEVTRMVQQAFYGWARVVERCAICSRHYLCGKHAGMLGRELRRYEDFLRDAQIKEVDECPDDT